MLADVPVPSERTTHTTPVGSVRALAAPGGCTPVAAFFDLDKTIIAGSSTLAFSGPLRDRGLIGRRALLRSGYAQLLLMVAGADADFMERMRERVSALCAGWDVAEVREVIDQALGEILHPMIYAEAAALIDEHHRRGHHVVVVSASGEEMVRPIAAALGAEHAAATRMTVVDGKYTGEIDFYCYGEGKAEAAKALAAEHGYRLDECYAYSDSITDLPLLEVVGHPHAVNPDRALRRVSVQRGWPVLNFVAPIPLRDRMRERVRSLLPARAASAALAVALAGLVAVAVLGAWCRGRQAAVGHTAQRTANM
ncbi:MAG: HAD-IB family hydrolase [Pseudonocardia sp.]|nr:HAD-IB family hydrolase [Pseudonocardia sp.]